MPRKTATAPSAVSVPATRPDEVLTGLDSRDAGALRPDADAGNGQATSATSTAPKRTNERKTGRTRGNIIRFAECHGRRREPPDRRIRRGIRPPQAAAGGAARP